LLPILVPMLLRRAPPELYGKSLIMHIYSSTLLLFLLGCPRLIRPARVESHVSSSVC
jgi:hypothetical protein